MEMTCMRWSPMNIAGINSRPAQSDRKSAVGKVWFYESDYIDGTEVDTQSTLLYVRNMVEWKAEKL